MLSVQLCGQPNSPAVTASASALLDEVRHRYHGNNYDFYGNFFMAQGMARLGGVFARDTQQFQANYFLPAQQRNGSWIGSGTEAAPGRVYTTTMAILSLTAREGRLPLLWR